jgi:hypothetical protein
MLFGGNNLYLFWKSCGTYKYTVTENLGVTVCKQVVQMVTSVD